MKKLNLIIGILITITTISCSSDEETDNNNNSEKKCTKFVFQNLNNQNQFTRNFFYDNDNNIIKLTDQNGKIVEKCDYNSSNQIVKHELFVYFDNVLSSKYKYNITYNSSNKISNILENTFDYNSDGDIVHQYSRNHNITYGDNSITKISDDSSNTKVEYHLDNNLITGIKVFRDNVVESDFEFGYDDEGNCISGSGPINQGYTTDNIDLTVSYGTEENTKIFNSFFDYEILINTNFNRFRQLLIEYQGNKYPEEIQWYQYNDNTYKETSIYSFDNEGYINTRTLSEFPNYPNYGKLTYTWE